MIEIWKNISEIEGMEQYGNYEVSNFGNVRSLKFGKVKILKPGTDGKGGYLYVNLSVNSKVKNFKIHRLVAKAFLPNPNNLPQVNHIDENKQNNNVNNLEWCTAEYNMNYGTRTERIVKAHKGKPSHNRKKIICIELNKVFNSVTEAANILNINQGYISSVLAGRYKQAKDLHFEYYDK